MRTVHAPHCATPQPYLVPVSPSFSRNTHNSGVSGSISKLRSLPLTFKVAISPILTIDERRRDWRSNPAVDHRESPPSADFGKTLRYVHLPPNAIHRWITTARQRSELHFLHGIVSIEADG